MYCPLFQAELSVGVIVFLDPEGVRIPAERRSKFDLLEYLEEQQTEISPNAYKKLIRKMQMVGLLDDATASQKLMKPSKSR